MLGPGEKLLSSHTDIGDSYESAEELRRRHEEMEIKCTVSSGSFCWSQGGGHAEEKARESSLSHVLSVPGM